MYSSKIQANEEIITRLLYRNMYRTMITYHTDMFILYIYMYNQMNTWDSQKFQIKRVLLFIDTDISWGSGSLNLCQVFFLYPFVRRKRVIGTIMTSCSAPPRSPLPRQCREVCPRKTALRWCIPPPKPLSSTPELRQKATEKEKMALNLKKNYNHPVETFLVFDRRNNCKKLKDHLNLPGGTKHKINHMTIFVH